MRDRDNNIEKSKGKGRFVLPLFTSVWEKELDIKSKKSYNTVAYTHLIAWCRDNKNDEAIAKSTEKNKKKFAGTEILSLIHI